MLKSRSGNYNSVGEKEMAYSSLSPSGKEAFYSVSTVNEKCEGCYNYTRCCESNCQVFENKVAMGIESPCQFCSYDSPSCYAAKKINDSSDYRPAIREFKVRTRDGQVWSYDDIDQLQDKQLKLLLAMRFINDYLKAIGRDDLLFKYKQSQGQCEVEFIGSKYSFKGHVTALEVLREAWPYALK